GLRKCRLRSFGRSYPPGGVRTPRRRRQVGGRVGSGPAGVAAGGLAASEGAEGGRAGDRRSRGDAARLPHRSEGPGCASRLARPVLGPGAGGLQVRGRTPGGRGRMNQLIMPAPVRRSIDVKVSQKRAFEVFTGSIAAWWPRSHHIGASDIKSVTIEPREGGRWFE